MNEIYIHKSKDYTVVCNNVFKNYELSYKAKGILLQMLSLPEDWDWSVRGLSSMATDGRDSVEKGIQELEKAGFLTRTQRRDESGKMCGYTYNVYESPQTEKPETEKPFTENPLTEKPSTENQPNKVLSNKVLSKYSSSSLPACEREDDKGKIRRWIEEADMVEQSERVFYRKELRLSDGARAHYVRKTMDDLIEQFYDFNYEVRELCSRNERASTLKYFQNWLPKYIDTKIKESEDAAKNSDRHQLPQIKPSTVIQSANPDI